MLFSILRSTIKMKYPLNEVKEKTYCDKIISEEQNTGLRNKI